MKSGYGTFVIIASIIVGASSTLQFLNKIAEKVIPLSVTGGINTLIGDIFPESMIGTIGNVVRDVVPNSLVPEVLPSCVLGHENIAFILFTRHIYGGEELRIEDHDFPLVIGQPVRFLIHGFTSEANTSEYFHLANAWLNQLDCNVISVQWRKGACTTGGIPLTNFLAYPNAVDNTEAVGQYVANLTEKLITEYGVRLNETLIAGHSLGAHVAGFAGKDVQKRGLGKYWQIIGLDPARPGFERKCMKGLCKSDAVFVQIFHTSVAFGILDAIGDDDFFFNGGRLQPDCPLNPICSHSRAVTYLTSVIKLNNCFVGVPWKLYSSKIPKVGICKTGVCTNPGPNAIYSENRGTFDVRTSDDDPYCTVP